MPARDADGLREGVEPLGRGKYVMVRWEREEGLETLTSDSRHLAQAECSAAAAEDGRPTVSVSPATWRRSHGRGARHAMHASGATRSLGRRCARRTATRHTTMTRDGCMRGGVHLRLVKRAAGGDGNTQAAGGGGVDEGSVGS
jgi:hypothetical protein